MRRHRRWAAGVAAGLGLLVAGIAVGFTVWVERESVEAVNARLAEFALWLLLWRISLFAILVVYWKELARWVARAFALDAESGAELVRWRWRALAGLLLMDLVLVEDLIGKVHRALA
jgi:hypothetical protein